MNAKIKYSYLGFDEDKELVIEIGFTTYVDDEVRTEKIELYNVEQIENILDALELLRWEDLPRKFARIKVDTETKRVVAIGAVVNEKWAKL